VAERWKACCRMWYTNHQTQISLQKH